MNTNSKWTGEIGRMWSFHDIKADGGPSRSVVHVLIKQGVLEPIKVGNLTRVTNRSYVAYKEAALLRGLNASPFAA
jgi:hypothetical protein